jgi:hypothetical protein
LISLGKKSDEIFDSLRSIFGYPAWGEAEEGEELMLEKRFPCKKTLKKC